MQNKKLLILSLILLLAMIFSMFSLYIYGSENTSVSARSAILYEPISGDVVFAKNENEKLPMASTTKIMTALIAIERLPLDTVVSIPSDAVGIEGSSVYLKCGDELTVKDLVYSVLLQSANDAATALAYAISGDIAGFSSLMNARATEMGCESTSFNNPHGLDDDSHYTTAKDLAIIAANALENDTFREICSTYKYSFNISGSPRTVVNHNKLLKMYDGAIGVKTGYTKKCGRCLVGAAERDGVRLISVTLDAPDDWSDHKAMLDLGFSLYKCILPETLSERSFCVPVISGVSQYVEGELDTTNLKIVSKRANTKIKAIVELPNYIPAPISEGDILGQVIYKYGDNIIAKANILAKETVSSAKIRGRLFSSLFK